MRYTILRFTLPVSLLAPVVHFHTSIMYRFQIDVCIADMTASAVSQSLLFFGKYPTDAFPPDTRYGVEISAIRSPSFDVVASLQFPTDSGVFGPLETINFIMRMQVVVSSVVSRWLRGRKMAQANDGVTSAGIC